MKCGIDDLSKIRNYSRAERDELIRAIKDLKVISNVQIARIFGINRKMVERA